MNNNEILDNDYVSDVGLSVTGAIRGYLETTAKWGRFLSIVGFIMTGLSLLSVFGMGAAFSEIENLMGVDFSVGVTFIITLYLIFLALLFFPCLFLYNFSTSTLRSLQNEEQIDFERAFHNLKRLYQFIGILIAIFLAFYLLIILIALVS
ncbi:MAG: hypothetical protein AB8G11_02250 [Saprospiraceae bacterium]